MFAPLRRSFLPLLLALTPLCAHAAEVATVVDGFSFPESVACDTAHCYVSNLGAELTPTEKQGDGFISRLTHDGKVVDRRFIDGLNAPKGLLVIDGTLYVATVGRLEGFSTDVGKKVFDVDFSKEGVLFTNGLAAGPGTTLYVSAMDAGKVYAVDRKKGDSSLVASVPGANGLAYEPASGALYVVGHEIGVIDTRAENAPYRPLSNYRGGLDGVVVDDAGQVIVSDWVGMERLGRLFVYDPTAKTLASMGLPQTVGGPADITMNRADGSLWIPAMLEGKVMIVRR